MAYAGYLIKLGGSSGTELPMTYIKAQSYNVEPDRHKENKTNYAVTGKLHRNIASHTSMKIEFDTPQLTNTQLAALETLFTNAMTDTTKKDITIYYYDTATDSYKTANCYMPDPKHPISRIDPVHNVVYFKPIRYTFIEY